MMTYTTKNLVDAALMRMRTKREPTCQWDERKHCTFVFLSVTSDDVAFVDSDPEVKAREFNYSLVQVKTAMYASKNG